MRDKSLISRCSKDDIRGGSPEENAKTVIAILKGEEQGPKRNAVLLNAGAALYGAGKAESMKAGVKLAAELIGYVISNGIPMTINPANANNND